MANNDFCFATEFESVSLRIDDTSRVKYLVPTTQKPLRTMGLRLASSVPVLRDVLNQGRENKFPLPNYFQTYSCWQITNSKLSDNTKNELSFIRGEHAKNTI